MDGWMKEWGLHKISILRAGGFKGLDFQKKITVLPIMP